MPSVYVLLAGPVASVLAGRPDCGNGDEVAVDPLIGLQLRSPCASLSEVGGGTGPAADVLGEGGAS